MALYNSMLGMDSQQPQQNQYLTGNPPTDPQANTLWMDQSQKSDNTGINGGGSIGNISQNQSTPPSQVSNGTMLGSIAAGSYGSAPLGFDAAKWNDPTQGTSLKYQVGRMAASGMSIDQIAAKVGAKVVGPDKIQYPDGFVADIYFDYGGPNQRVQYTDVTPGQGGMQQGSMMGMQQGNNPFAQNNMMQQIWQQLQARRQQFAGQQFNPTGGNIGAQDSRTIYQPPSGNTGVSGQIGMNPQPQSSMIGMTPQTPQQIQDILSQVWAGTYRPPNYGAPQ